MLTSIPELDSAGHEIQRAVVIGAAGFIGAKLSSVLANQHVDTACFTRRTRALGDRDELSYALQRASIVYYLASSINPTLGEQHPDWAASDHRMFSRLLSKLANRDEPPTVVLTSSGGTVYDQHVAPPYSELSPLRATGRYGAAKLALEEELHKYSDRIPGVILRLSNVYGPGQLAGKGQGVLGYWLRSVLDGEPLRIIGDPECSRDYVYISDVVNSIWKLDNALRSGRFFCGDGVPGSGGVPGEPALLNIGSGIRTSLAELVEVVRGVLGGDIPVLHTAGRELDRKHVWLDVGKAAEVLEWRPRVPLEEGVRQMWQWTVEREKRKT